MLRIIRRYSSDQNLARSMGRFEANLVQEQGPSKPHKGYRQQVRKVFSKEEKAAVVAEEASQKANSTASHLERIHSLESRMNKPQVVGRKKRSIKRMPSSPVSKKNQIIGFGNITVEDKQKSVGTIDSKSIPRLRHSLDRTLFSPGLHWFQDPRTRIYNFSPDLKSIPNVDTFNFDALDPFKPVDKDQVLTDAAFAAGKQFYSSTSSMTSTLIMFYMLLNNYNSDYTNRFDFKLSVSCQQRPALVTVQYRGHKNNKPVYSVSSDKSTATHSLLGAMGHCLEAFLTTPTDEFSSTFINSKDQPPPAPQPSVYNYSGYSDFLMRSQLDCYDDRLPGKGTFDLKTRVAIPYRMNPTRHQQDSTYQIFKPSGDFESFQRENIDLVKTGAMLKYMFQARIGQMDGIYIAYHNLSKFFGFQYLPLETLDEMFYSMKQRDIVPARVHSQPLASHLADIQFKQSIKLWELVLKQVIKDMPARQSFRLAVTRHNYFFAGHPCTALRFDAIPVSENTIEELGSFPTKYRVSYTEKLSPSEYFGRLEKHEADLLAYNQKLVENNKVFGTKSYLLKIHSHTVDNRKFPGWVSVLPRSDTASMSAEYCLQRIPMDLKDPQPTREHINTVFTKPFFWRQGRTPVEKQIRMFEMVGNLRQQQWQEGDEKDQTYVPRL